MTGRRSWTPLMDEYLFTKRLKGESFPEIGAALGVSYKSARARFERRFPSHAGTFRAKPKKRHSEETRLSVIRCRLAGKSLKKTACELGMTVNQVHGIWWQWNNFLFIRERAA